MPVSSRRSDARRAAVHFACCHDVPLHACCSSTGIAERRERPRGSARERAGRRCWRPLRDSVRSGRSAPRPAAESTPARSTANSRAASTTRPTVRPPWCTTSSRVDRSYGARSNPKRARRLSAGTTCAAREDDAVDEARGIGHRGHLLDHLDVGDVAAAQRVGRPGDGEQDERSQRPSAAPHVSGPRQRRPRAPASVGQDRE